MSKAMTATTRQPPIFSVCILTIGLVCSSVAPGLAAEIRFGGMVPGAGVIRKEVTSTRERRYLNLVRQETDFSCGAASVATILKYAYGKDTSEIEVLEQMFQVSDKETVLRRGFSLLDIKRYVQSIGMQAIGLRLEPEKLDQIKIPTIVLLDIKGYLHFVVLKKAKGNKVYLADPALGNKIMATEDFVASWNGVVLAVVADGYQQDSILAQPSEALSAKKLLGSRSPVVGADALGFGFNHADLFRF